MFSKSGSSDYRARQGTPDQWGRLKNSVAPGWSPVSPMISQPAVGYRPIDPAHVGTVSFAIAISGYRNSFFGAVYSVMQVIRMARV